MGYLYSWPQKELFILIQATVFPSHHHHQNGVNSYKIIGMVHIFCGLSIVFLFLHLFGGSFTCDYTRGMLGNSNIIITNVILFNIIKKIILSAAISSIQSSTALDGGLSDWMASDGRCRIAPRTHNSWPGCMAADWWCTSCLLYMLVVFVPYFYGLRPELNVLPRLLCINLKLGLLF